jgi:hypothetical protein
MNLQNPMQSSSLLLVNDPRILIIYRAKNYEKNMEIFGKLCSRLGQISTWRRCLGILMLLDYQEIRNNEGNLKIAKASHRFPKVCGRLAVRQALHLS